LRWLTLEKVPSAREQIIRILQSLTDISAAELGRRVGVSRERVRQILKDLGYPSARGKGRPFGPSVLAGVSAPGTRRIGKPTAVRLVAEDLLARGFAIFAPVRTTRACDLVAVSGRGTVNLITVCMPGTARKPVRRTRGARPRRLAFVSPGLPIRYEPPLNNGHQGRQTRSN
jgi:hypothetical protein